ncbi:MAG TPA: hypothetical protein VIX17_11730 [Pyrinomonadaceae bacterium]|jgi:hypothetical protein
MARVSKKTLRAIQGVSVFDSILRERFTSSMTGYFADHAPEMWNDEQKEIFDIASEVEDKLKDKVLDILNGGEA